MSGKNIFKLSAFLVLVFAALPFFAQVPGEAWTRLAVSYSGNITALAVSPSYETDQTLFIGVKNGGLWRSSDRGETWSQCTAVPCDYTVTGIGLGKDYQYGTGDPCFVVTWDTWYYRSTDDFQGYTYAQQFLIGSMALFPGPLSGIVLGTSGGAFNGDVYVATYGGGVFFHDTGGGSSSWTNIGPFAYNCRSLTLTSDATQVLWLSGTSSGGVGGVYRYLGSGLGWAAHETELGASDVLTVRAAWGSPAYLWAGSSTLGIWYSTDSGASWSEVEYCPLSATGYDVQVRAVREIPQFNNNGVWIGTSGGLRRSYHHGDSCGEIQPRSSINCIDFSPLYDGTGNYCEAFVGTESALYRIPCAAAPAVRSPVVADGHAVAIAKNGYGTFMGSLSSGLFKSPDNASMVRYNSFPNGKTPEIEAVCLHPEYAQDEVGCSNEETLFVAANFPDSPADNGVYQTTDAGNSWTKVDNASTWPTSTTYVKDLAISPSYAADSTLYAATSRGIYQWAFDVKDGRMEWNNVSTPYFLDSTVVALPPGYDGSLSSCPYSYTCNGTTYSGFPCKTVWAYGYDTNNSRWCLWFSRNKGDSWTPIYPSSCPSGAACPTDITGITFPANFVDGPAPSSKVYVSSSSKGILLGELYSSYCFWTDASNWTTKNSGIPFYITRNAADIAADPDWVDGTTHSDDTILCAVARGDSTPPDAVAGVYRTTTASEATPTWSQVVAGHAYSVAWESRKIGDTHAQAMAGFERDASISASSPYGAYLSTDSGASFTPFSGYRSLPDDVFATAAHERDPDYIFASSPSMGVFVSADKGENFRPYNVGAGGAAGPCRLTNGYGITMARDRVTTDIDAIYVGTRDGIKARYIYYDSALSKIYLDKSDGAGSPNSWLHSNWQGGGATSGYWERLESSWGQTTTMPVWAASPAFGAMSGQGFASLPVGSYDGWILQTSGLTSTDATSVRAGSDGGAYAYVQIAPGQVASGCVKLGGQSYYRVSVSDANNDLRVTLDDPDGTLGGGQNCGLYLRYGTRPTSSTYDFSATTDGDKSICVKRIYKYDFADNWGPNGDNPPTGWTITTNESPVTWDTNNWYNGGSGVPRVNGTTGRTSMDESITSPAFDIPATSEIGVELRISHRFYVYSGATVHGYTKIWSDQHPAWTTIDDHTTSMSRAASKSIAIPDTYKGNTNVRLKFEYVDSAPATQRYWYISSVEVNGLRTGAWYIGVFGMTDASNCYTLTVETDTGCVQSFSMEENAAFAPPDPLAPVGGITWGTVGLEGVKRGTGGTSVNFEDRNGTTAPLGNLAAQTVMQLSDLTLVAGCNPSGGTECIWYSPSPDEGLTTWYAADEIASEGSKDYVDILQASNGDVLMAGNGTGTGSAAGGVWLSGDRGKNWMRISQGFDGTSQALSDIVADGSTEPSYYASTDQTGLWTRSITASPYPSVTGIAPDNGDDTGGTPVTITGTGFSSICPTEVDADCPDLSPVVIFGDNNGSTAYEVSGTYVDAGTITAVSPQHPAGNVVVRVRNRDTRESAAGVVYTFNSTCQPPSGLPDNTAIDADPCADTGVLVGWADPADWGDGGSGTRTFDMLRDGSIIQAGISSSTHENTDTTGTNGTSYTYSIRANNGCGMSSETPGTSAADILCMPPEVGPGDSEANAQDWTEDKLTQTWPTAERATEYRLYRMIFSELANLMTAAEEGCLREVGSVTAFDCGEDDPGSEAGRTYFYLVTGVNETGEGTAGNGTGFTRSLSSSSACAP